MWKFIIVVSLLNLQFSNCYNKHITLGEYSKCKRESIIGPGSRYVTSYMKFQEFIPIDSLVYGTGPRESRVKFYFQGPSHFGVGFLSQSKEPALAEPIVYFQISCEPNTQNESSYIYLNTAETMYCASKPFPNPMNNTYFTEIEIVINKEFGFVAAFLPDSGPRPFISCNGPEIFNIASNVEYIGITGRNENVVRYIYDCPDQF